MYTKLSGRKRLGIAAVTALTAASLLAGCSNDNKGEGPANSANPGDNAAAGDTVVIGFSGPAADHGWLGAINSAAKEMADSFPDVELVIAEGTNDPALQIRQ